MTTIPGVGTSEQVKWLQPVCNLIKSHTSYLLTVSGAHKRSFYLKYAFGELYCVHFLYDARVPPAYVNAWIKCLNWMKWKRKFGKLLLLLLLFVLLLLVTCPAAPLLPQDVHKRMNQHLFVTTHQSASATWSIGQVSVYVGS